MSMHDRILRRLGTATRLARKHAEQSLHAKVVRTGNTPQISDLNEWQRGFCAWQAERSGTAELLLRQRLLASINAIRGGHGGPDFRRFCLLSYAIYLPFAADTKVEVLEAYKFHTHMHMLRMLSYPCPAWRSEHPVVVGLKARDAVSITDFGCGLAQKSISLARKLREQGKEVRLFLADVSALQLGFLDWFCKKDGLKAQTFHCTAEARFPDFPPADVMFAEELLEHVHDPVAYVEALDQLTAPGGFFVGNLCRHREEFMHVSPDLGRARDRLLSRGYRELRAAHVFGKPAPA
jgi:SAM-dependent methyltransferase